VANNARSPIQALRETDGRYMIAPTLVDSCVLIDVLANDPDWADWSLDKLDLLGQHALLVINPIILAEISPRFDRAADLGAALQMLPIKRDALPWDAACLAGQAFKIYRTAKRAKRSPMPDFYIGAHALVGNMRLLARDAVRFQTYFPKLNIISP
jgi:predicted nucleic acid-binding protein